MSKLSVSTGFYIFLCSFTIVLSFTQDPNVKEQPCNISSDASKLNAAISKGGRNDGVLIEILSLRTVKQKQDIFDYYQKTFHTSFRDDLAKVTSTYEDYGKLLIALTYPTNEFLSIVVHDALASNDHWAYMQILLTAEGDQIPAIKKAYETKYNIPLLKDIENRLYSAQARFLLLRVLGGTDLPYRDSSPQVHTEWLDTQWTWIPNDKAACNLQDNAVLFTFLSTSNLEQIGAVVKKYDDKNGNGAVYNDIRKHCPDEILNIGYCVITQYAAYKEVYYAMILKDALGKDLKGSSINNILTWRAEIDLHSIKKAYIDLTHQSLEDAVSGRASGQYKDLLLKLIGGNVGP